MSKNPRKPKGKYHRSHQEERKQENPNIRRRDDRNITDKHVELGLQDRRRLEEGSSTGKQLERIKERKYQRREIIDPGCRSQDITQDETVLSKGEDFQYLLENSGSGSHFLLNEEKHWEDDELPASCDFLRINFNAIKAALDTVPLHTRLNISSDVFLPADIECFERMANEKRLIFEHVQMFQPKNAVMTCEASKGGSSKVDANATLPAELENLDDLLSLSSSAHTSLPQFIPSEKPIGRSSSFEELLNLTLED